MAGDLFETPRHVVWGYRALAAALVLMWIPAKNPAFLLTGIASLAVGHWMSVRAVLVTEQAVLVSRVHGPPREAPLWAISAIEDDAGRWNLRLFDGSELSLPPIGDRAALVSAIRNRVPKVEVLRRVRAGGLLGRWRSRNASAD